MIRDVIATGRDVNSAIDSGCAELGINREDAQFEIISLPKKGFLGLKTYPAKVKVFEEIPDPPKAVPKPAPKAVPPAAKPIQPPKPAPAARPEPAQPPKSAPAARPAPVQPPRPAPAQRSEPFHEEFHEEASRNEIVPTLEVREKTEKAAAYLAEIMRAMGFETIEVTPAYYSENVCLKLGGAQLGVVIGRRGETLDALQYLTSLVANRGEGEYIRVNIDSGNYREKREKTLTALARKLALQAVRTGKSTTLEPMNPYERRVIHGAVSQIRGAVSTSIGADPNRRVVISAADGSAKPAVGGRDRRDRRDRDSKAPRPPAVALRPNTNTAESVAAAKNEQIAVRRTDDGAAPHTAVFTASRTRPAEERPAPPAPPVTSAMPKPASPPAHPKKLSDAELFGDIPMGVPVVASDHPAARKEYVPAPKPIPKKLDGELYGKI